MTSSGWIALAIAVFSSFCFAAASILQAIAASRSRSTMRTLRHPLYLLGTAADVVAWLGSMVALRELAVYLVESVLASSLAVTVVAARLILKSRLRRRDGVAVVVSVAALTVLAMSAGPQESVAASGAFRFWFCAAALALTLLGWVAAKTAPPGIVAALAGLCLGGAALAGRALALPEQPESATETLLAIVTEPLTTALLVLAAAGILLYTHALQHGQVGPVTAVLWIAEVVAPSAIALLLLGDSVRPGWEAAALIAGAVTVGAAVVLSTAPATGETARAAEAIEATPETVRAPEAIGAAPVRPALPQLVPDPNAVRVIWWGSPPIWRPPARGGAPVPARSAPRLSWAAPPLLVEPARPVRQRPETHAAEVWRPAAERQAAGVLPWHDL